MFFSLFLAHILGDFVLQPNWMASQKNKLWVLILHGFVHFILMILLVGQIRSQIWSQLLLLAVYHIAQDRLKIFVNNRWPERLTLFFFVDQILHLLSIFYLTYFIRNIASELIHPAQLWMVVVSVYLLVTYTWFIVERIIYHSNPEYLKNIEDTKFPRMFARTGMVSLFFLIRAAIPLYSAFFLNLPYPKSVFRKRAILTDLGISLSAIIFLFFALGID